LKDVSTAFRLTAITRDPDLAARCDAAGVDRIGVDIERLGKTDRQGHIPGARISDHELADLASLAKVVRRGKLFARLNPPHAGAGVEIDAALAAGAQVLMLPYFTQAAQVERFVRRVDGRAEATLLLETAAAVNQLPEILAVDGVAEIIVGMNDLSLSYGLSSLFELYASDLLAQVSDQVRARGVSFGFGGLGRAGDETLPVAADLVIAQHARVGSRAAWLSRSFFGPDPATLDVTTEVAALRARLDLWAARPRQDLQAQRDALRRRVAALGEPV
jgi:hypothetical protein